MLILTTLIVLLPGCEEPAKKSGGLNTQSAAAPETEPAPSKEPAGLRDLDLGQNWDAGTTERRTLNQSRQTSAPSNTGSLPRPVGSVVTSDAEVAPTTVWMVVLGTFSGDNQDQAAQTMLREVRTMDPMFQDAWIHKTTHGAIVGFGKFDTPDDPAAQKSLKLTRSIEINGRPVFSRAMLSRVTPSTRGAQLKPYALLNARRLYPNVNPLYTLDIGVWLTDEAGSMKLAEVRRRSEAYAQQLRAQGYEAYFHHDDDKQLSTVTVGLFDHRAIDPESGLLSPEVKALRDRFPARLVNGEVLNVPIDPRRPSIGTEVQRPFLVLVPEE